MSEEKAKGKEQGLGISRMLKNSCFGTADAVRNARK
jgi:hypothetical protein